MMRKVLLAAGDAGYAEEETLEEQHDNVCKTLPPLHGSLNAHRFGDRCASSRLSGALVVVEDLAS